MDSLQHQCRRAAEECFRVSQQTRDLDREKYLLELGQQLRNLADALDRFHRERATIRDDHLT